MTDINKETVFVTINSARRIPFLNASGPINTPISVLKTVVAQLKALGYPVKEHPYVGINASGNREILTEESFIARQEGQIVDAVTTDPAPALIPSDVTDAPAPVSDVVIVEQPEELEDEDTEESENAEKEVDETADTVESEETSDQEEPAATDTTDEVVEEEPADTTTAEETTTEVADETAEEEEVAEDGEELDVYDFNVYEGWSKQLLVNYLRKAEQFLPEEVQKETNSANKTRLLEIIKQYIIDAAE